MEKKYKAYRIVDRKPKWVITDENENIINRNPSKDELKNFGISKHGTRTFSRDRNYNSTDTCDRIKENGKRCGKDISMGAYKEKDKYETWTGNWICQKCYNTLMTYGTTDIDTIKRESDKNYYDAIEIQYGKDFADWARENKGNISDAQINLGCKTRKEYLDKLAQKRDCENDKDYQRKWRQETGRSGIAIEANEDCESWFGEFVENFMIHRYPGAKKMPYGNPGFDYLWNGIKIDNKGRCLDYGLSGMKWTFPIFRNNIADIFTLSGWDNRENLNPMYAWKFEKNDIVRHRVGSGYILKKFWQKEYIVIPFTPEGMKEFKDYEIDIEWLKELCRKEKNKNEEK